MPAISTRANHVCRTGKPGADAGSRSDAGSCQEQATAVRVQAEQLAAVPAAGTTAGQPQAPGSSWRTKKRKSGGRQTADHGDTVKSKRLSAGRRLSGRQSFRTGWAIVTNRKMAENGSRCRCICQRC